MQPHCMTSQVVKQSKSLPSDGCFLHMQAALPQQFGVQASTLPDDHKAALQRASLAITCTRLAVHALAAQQSGGSRAACDALTSAPAGLMTRLVGAPDLLQSWQVLRCPLCLL